MTMKILLSLGCLLVAVNAGTYGGPKTSLEDIENDYTGTDRSSAYSQTTKTSASSVPSPTKFGFVPQRTASSYAATKPKYQYAQTNYQVKKSAHKPQSAQYQQYANQYSQTKPQTAYQQYYSAGPTQQYALPEKYSGSDSAQQYSDSQQYLTQQQGQDYAYVQPDVNQQYSVQYQQPLQQYEQYENVQYVSDNSIAQPDSKQYYLQPQYYYVQQVQSPSTAVESVLDPKAVQYVMFAPSYAANSIPADQKYQQQYTTGAELQYQQQYTTGAEPQLPPVTTTVAKYTTVVPGKSSSSKQYASQKEVQYVVPSSKTQYQQQEGVIFKREPKSLLDSYVPSILQLQYLKQQGKSSYSKY